MKVRKIDIIEKIIELPASHGDIYREAQYDPSQMRVMDIGSNPDFTTTVRENTYQIKEVFRKHYGLTHSTDREYVAVRLDQNGLFGDLLKVTDDILSMKLTKAREEGFWEGESKGAGRGIKQERERISSLPWWKRMLNKTNP